MKVAESGNIFLVSCIIEGRKSTVAKKVHFCGEKEVKHRRWLTNVTTGDDGEASVSPDHGS
jgi:hypothetical protein